LTQTVEIGEEVEKGEMVEIANIHAYFMHVVEKIVGRREWLWEYPTLSAITLDAFRSCLQLSCKCTGYCARSAAPTHNPRHPARINWARDQLTPANLD
jgi:hypothetical protein